MKTSRVERSVPMLAMFEDLINGAFNADLGPASSIRFYDCGESQ